MSEQVEMDRKGQCAYEAWMRGCGSMPFVPWDRLDERDRQHHVEWAQRYEVMLESKPESVEQMAFDLGGAA